MTQLSLELPDLHLGIVKAVKRSINLRVSNLPINDDTYKVYLQNKSPSLFEKMSRSATRDGLINFLCAKKGREFQLDAERL